MNNELINTACNIIMAAAAIMTCLARPSRYHLPRKLRLTTQLRLAKFKWRPASHPGKGQ